MRLEAKNGWLEVALAAVLYGVYEVVRGLGGDDFVAAQAHAELIVQLERGLGIYRELGIQELSLAVPGAAAAMGFAYMAMHFLGTTAFLVWVFRRRRHAFPFVRTAIVLATGLALVGYLAFPTAPPRLAGLGFADAVTSGTGLNLSSDLLGALYNPVAAVPSLHFGYALLVGVGVATLAARPWIRRLGIVYPAVMLYLIVATGNHFFLDAAAGALAVGVAWFVAAALVRPAADESYAYA